MYYNLDENKNVVECDLDTWERARDIKHVRVTEFKNPELKISTVFLGLDHRFGILAESTPIVFETMIFWDGNKRLDQYQNRYCTYQQAVEGHKEALKICIAEVRRLKLKRMQLKEKRAWQKEEGKAIQDILDMNGNLLAILGFSFAVITSYHDKIGKSKLTDQDIKNYEWYAQAIENLIYLKKPVPRMPS